MTGSDHVVRDLLLANLNAIVRVSGEHEELIRPTQEIEPRVKSLAGRSLLAAIGASDAVKKAVEADYRELPKWSPVGQVANYLLALLQGVNPVNPKTLLTDIDEVVDKTRELVARARHAFDEAFLTDEQMGAPATQLAEAALTRSWQQLAALATEMSQLRAYDAAQGAIEALQATRDAAGQTADVKLGHHYAQVATTEDLSAKRYRRAAIAAFVVAGLIAAYVSYVILGEQQEGIVSQLFKFLTTLPAIGLGLWFSHESNNHRTVSRRAKEVEVRLYTMEAFMEPLNEEQRAELRAEVGKSLLIGPLVLSPGTEVSAVDLQAVIEKLIDKA